MLRLVWVAAIDGLLVEILDAFEGSADCSACMLPILHGIAKFGWKALAKVLGHLPEGEVVWVVRKVLHAVVRAWRTVNGEVLAHVVSVGFLGASPRRATVSRLTLHLWVVVKEQKRG